MYIFLLHFEGISILIFFPWITLACLLCDEAKTFKTLRCPLAPHDVTQDFSKNLNGSQWGMAVARDEVISIAPW